MHKLRFYNERFFCCREVVKAYNLSLDYITAVFVICKLIYIVQYKQAEIYVV